MNWNIGNIGVWGFRHYEFLKQNRPSTVWVMRMNNIRSRAEEIVLSEIIYR